MFATFIVQISEPKFTDGCAYANTPFGQLSPESLITVAKERSEVEVLSKRQSCNFS